jgi:hypothetical protein
MIDSIINANPTAAELRYSACVRWPPDNGLPPYFGFRRLGLFDVGDL